MMSIQLLLTLLSVIRATVTGNTNCPSSCNSIACLNGILSCSNPGLTHIPTVLPPKTDRILLINQDFSKANELSYVNISNYGPPEFKVIKIAIQHSQLVGIASETFSHLHNLHTLDLSFNRIQIIQPRTFEALNLDVLRLDGNFHLELLCTSFQKSIIRMLSLVNCSITVIDYCALKPIFGVLKNLILSHNHLKTIDQKFDILFQRLEEVSLNDNLFQCYGCQLIWLSHSLKTRLHKSNYSQLSEKSLALIFPKCAGPQYLEGTFIHRLTEEDFVCSAPAIQSIDVTIDRFENLTLSCHSSSTSDRIVWLKPSLSNRVLKARTITDVHRNEAAQEYFCMVSNRQGNISTRIKINWPRTLTPINGASPSTGPTTLSSENTFHDARFSLLEVIAAVVATFSSFLVVFIVVIKYSFSQRDNKLFQYPMIVECKKNFPNRTSLTTNFNYRDPELMRYDWSGHASYGNSGTYDFPTSPASVFLDFKTHEQIQTS